MEIISIYTRHKDDSILDFYPNEYSQEDLDLSSFESFIDSTVANKDASDVIELERSSYDIAVELIGTDDLPCPMALIIEYKIGQTHYIMSIPFNRSTKIAYVSVFCQTHEEVT